MKGKIRNTIYTAVLLFIGAVNNDAPVRWQERSIFDKFNNIIRRAFQNLTKLFQGVHGDAFISFEIGNGVRAETQFVDQRILGNALFFHCAPQGVIAYHIHSTLSLRYPYYLPKNTS